MTKKIRNQNIQNPKLHHQKNINIHFMRKLFFSFLLLISVVNLFAQHIELKGNEASKLINNAQFIRFNQEFKLPNYVEYQEGTALKNFDWQTQALNLIKDKINAKFELYKTESDNIGWTHERYIQTQNNIPVEGSMIIVHSNGNQIISWNGEYFSGLPKTIEPTLSEKDALAKALSAYPAEVYMWQNADNEKFIKIEQESENATFLPKGELVYKAEANKLAPGHFHLCWKFNIYCQIPLKRANIYIDAITGKVIDEENLIHTGNVVGSATTKYSGTQAINTDSVNANNYRLRQTALGGGVETYNLLKSTSYSNTDFIDTDNNWNNVNANKDEVATDAHFGAEQTYRYYFNRYGRKSYDNLNTKLRSYVHYSNNYDNAFWDGQRMTYGDGNQLKPLTCIDVAAHEMSHGVTGNSSKLVYNGESGALNESFSDIFGTAVEFTVKSGNQLNFIIGEDITAAGNGIRSMKNPSLFGDPGAYGDNNWYVGAADNGGVHTNSGVQNHWFYILTMGESATNFKGNAYNVKGVGIDTAGAISYRNNAFYLTPNSKYADSRFYSIQAAKDLYGKCNNAVKQCTNAWYAVNVGNAFDTSVNADFSANPFILCSKNDAAIFINTSSNAVSYLWDFGDSKTSTLENPSHVYSNYGIYSIKLTIQGCNGGSDTLTRVGYIQVDSTLTYCKAFKLPITGNGGTFTACKGTLKDNGGDNNYSDNSDSYAVLSPTNASYIKLIFTQFNMENPGDYVYIYEGTSIAGKLIGQYSGSSLPNGGIIYTTSGSVTIRQVSDASLTYSGFALDWECIQKVANDAGIISINNISGRENTAIALKSNESIVVDIKNFGSNTLTNFPVNYRINGGNTVTETYTGSIVSGNTATYTFTQKADLSAAGYYFLEVWTSLTADSVNTQNNQTVKTIKQIENKPLQLPYFEGFEGNAAFSQVTNMIGLDSTDRYDYFNTRTGNGRLRTNAGPGYYNGGQRAITFDQYPATNANGPFNTNLLRLTVNLSTQTNDVFLDFSFMHHGDETTDSDKVWVRGNDQAAWVQLYNLQTKTNLGVYNSITGINLTQALRNVGQTMGKSMQIMFGQKNNGTSGTISANDGITFDDISLWIDVKDIGIAQTTQPKSGCGLSNVEQVKVDVFNYGTALSNQSGKINMRLNNGSVISQNVSFTISRNGTQSYTFTQTVDLSATGNYIIETWTTLVGDVDATNDSLKEQVISAPAMTPLTITPSGPVDFCLGDSVALVANSGYNSYLWSNGKTTQSIVVKSGGTYTCTVSNAVGCKLSKSQAVTVNLKPIAGFNWSINKNLVSFTNLTGGNNNTYLWDFADGDTSSLKNPQHTFQATSTYNVKLSATNNCGTTTDQHSINITSLGVKEITKNMFSVSPNPFKNSFVIDFNSAENHNIKVYDLSGKLIKEQTTKELKTSVDLSSIASGLYLLYIDGNQVTKLIKE